MELIIGIIVGLVVITILVVLHELGHAIVSRRNGVVVEEFGIGFPPTAWAKKFKNSATKYIAKDSVVFSLNWLPLGGFVKLKGEYDAASKKGDYGASSYWVKTKILLAGVAVNWLTAALLLTVLAWTGLPKILPDQFTVSADTKIVHQPMLVTVLDESPAAKAGLQTGDELLRIAGERVVVPEDATRLTEHYKGKTVSIVYSRDGQQKHSPVTLRSDNDDKNGYLGVGTRERPELIYASWSAPLVGFVTTAQLTIATLDGIGQVLANVWSGLSAQFSSDETVQKAGNEDLAFAGDSIYGPIGIFGILFPAASSAGLTMLVLVIALISLALAIANMLPIPGLDGGRWFTMTAFRLLKKPLTKELEMKIQMIGYLIIMALLVLVVIADVSKFN